ncbi:hypothetical protein H0E87_030211 [Populus deltoides]|uniref:Uncharacterized protein n=1 Tax=Populus deltoides TaxID=3696 RepID=A0A8T2WHS3_POPDE|nr:hypothetical protein H0E87_030211 [Populus deltoides]
MGLSSGALPIRDIIIRELSSQVLVSQAPHNHAPTHWALTRRDGVPEESIVKSSGCVPATPTTPTSKNVVGKVLASKPPVSDVIVLPVLPQRIVLSTSPPDQNASRPNFEVGVDVIVAQLSVGRERTPAQYKIECGEIITQFWVQAFV